MGIRIVSAAYCTSALGVEKNTKARRQLCQSSIITGFGEAQHL